MFKIMNIALIMILLSNSFSGCSKTVEPSEDEKLVEQKIWHDDYYEETIVTTENNNSNVVSTIATKQQSVNIQEMDKLTLERIDRELARREKEDMDFLSTTDKVSKVLVEVAAIVGTVIGAVLREVIRYQAR